jgi:hypothetical protein
VHPPKWMVFKTSLANFRETPNTRTSENSVKAKFPEGRLAEVPSMKYSLEAFCEVHSSKLGKALPDLKDLDRGRPRRFPQPTQRGLRFVSSSCAGVAGGAPGHASLSRGLRPSGLGDTEILLTQGTSAKEDCRRAFIRKTETRSR